MTFFFSKTLRPTPTRAVFLTGRYQQKSLLWSRPPKYHEYLLAPLFPITDLLDPTGTASLPVIVPVTTTILATSSATADLSAANDETVVVAPPLPPLVLCAVVSWNARIVGKKSL